MPEDIVDDSNGDNSWPTWRRFVIAELKRGILNDEKTVRNLDDIKRSISKGDMDRAGMEVMLKSVSRDQKLQLGILDDQQRAIGSMKTKWAIVIAIGWVLAALVEHLLVPYILSGIHK